MFQLIQQNDRRFRGSRLQVFYRVAVLKKFANFSEKLLQWTIILLKVQANF